MLDNGVITGQRFVNTEAVIGTAGKDWITGTTGDNTIEGGAGPDVLAGGGGADTLSYIHSSSGVSVALRGASSAATASGGDAAGDVATGFIHLRGSAHDDRLSGDGRDNIIEGGAGADRLDGGAGTDTLSYAHAASGVEVDLSLRTAQPSLTTAPLRVSGADIKQPIIIDHLMASAQSLSVAAGDVVYLAWDASKSVWEVKKAASLPEGAIRLAEISPAGTGINLGIDAHSGLSFTANNNNTGGTVAIAKGTHFWITPSAGDMVYLTTLSNSAGSSGSGGYLIGFGKFLPPAATFLGRINDSGSGLEDGAADGLVFASLSLSAAQSLTRKSADVGGQILYGLRNGASVELRIGTGLPAGAYQLGRIKSDGSGLEAGASAYLTAATSGANITFNIRPFAVHSLSVNGHMLVAQEAAKRESDGDVIRGFENLTGSAFDDILTGDSTANILKGGAGDDILAGGGGDDVLRGGAGSDTADFSAARQTITAILSGPRADDGALSVQVDADTIKLYSIENLIGGAGRDILAGDDGANVIDGGAGADTLDGGAGFDTLSFASSATGITASFSDKADSDGWRTASTGDRYRGFEAIRGSEYDDHLTGGAGADRLDGGGGDDYIRGGAGNDVLHGGAGDDIIHTDRFDADTIDGGAGIDQISFAGRTSGVQFDLARALDGKALTEIYKPVEIELPRVLKKSFDDITVTSSSNFAVLVYTDGKDVKLIQTTNSFRALTADEARDVAGMVLVGSGYPRLNNDNSAIDKNIDADELRLIGRQKIGNVFSYEDGDNDGDKELTVTLPARRYIDFMAGSDATPLGIYFRAQGSRNQTTLSGDDGTIKSVYIRVASIDIQTRQVNYQLVTSDQGQIHPISEYSRIGAVIKQDGAWVLRTEFRNIEHFTLSGNSLTLAKDKTVYNYAKEWSTTATGDSLTSIEGVIGTDYIDLLSGDGRDNILTGGPGGDVLDGRGGDDTASYQGAVRGVAVDLASGGGIGHAAGLDSRGNFKLPLIFDGSLTSVKPGQYLYAVKDAKGKWQFKLVSDPTDAANGRPVSSILLGRVNANGTGFESGAASGLRIVPSFEFKEINSATWTREITDSSALVPNQLIFINTLTLSTADGVITFWRISTAPESFLTTPGVNRIILGQVNAEGTGLVAGSYKGLSVETNSQTGKLSKISLSDIPLTKNVITYAPSDIAADSTGDKLVSIEHLIGSEYSDELRGDAGVNRIDGRGGDDVIKGGRGADILTGGAGDDVISGHGRQSSQQIIARITAGDLANANKNILAKPGELVFAVQQTNGKWLITSGADEPVKGTYFVIGRVSGDGTGLAEGHIAKGSLIQAAVEFQCEYNYSGCEYLSLSAI